MKKISTTTFVFAIVALVAAIALISLSVVYGAPRITTERYGMFEMRSYRLMDASYLPVIFAIVGSALMIVSCNLFLFTAKAKCCHHHHHEHDKICECKKEETTETAETVDVAEPEKV